MASEYVVQSCLAPAIHLAATAMPGLPFDVLPLAGNAAQLLLNGDIDLLLAGQSLDVGMPAKAEVFEDDFVCLACAVRGLKETELTLETYLEGDHVVVRYGRDRTMLDDGEALRRAGKRRKRHITVWTYSVLPNLICGTSLIATDPARAAIQIEKRWPMLVHLFPFPQEKVRIYAYWHSSRYKDDVLARFLRMLT